MKAKIVGFVSLFLLFLVFFDLNANAEQTVSQPSADAADNFAIYDINAEIFLMNKKIDDPISPASTVKIMSGLIACEKLCEKIDEYVTLTESMLSGVTGKTMGLCPGKRIKIKDLMFSAYGCGYNDAATALAVIAAGSEDKMTELMNSRARALGMYSTYYTNVTGIDDPNMKTSVRDIVSLSVKASDNKLFLEVSTVYNYTVKYADGTEQTVYGNNESINKNSPYYCGSAKGMNSGSNDSGACVVTYGEHGDMRCLAVAMGCSLENESRFELIQNSLDWAYKNSYKVILKEGFRVGTANVEMTQTESTDVALILSEDMSVIAKNAEDASLIRYTLIINSESLTAPLQKGSLIGKYLAWRGNEIIGYANVTIDQNVEKSSFVGFLKSIEAYIKSRAFAATLISFVIISSVLIICPQIALSMRQKKRKYLNQRSGFNIKNKK